MQKKGKKNKREFEGLAPQAGELEGAAATSKKTFQRRTIWIRQT